MSFSSTFHDDCDDGIDALLSSVDKVMTLKSFYCIPLFSWLSWLIRTGITLFELLNMFFMNFFPFCHHTDHFDLLIVMIHYVQTYTVVMQL
jgi:uncharacterized membrane protein (DUF106 family)